MVRDGEAVIKGRENIFEYFKELKDYLAEWLKFQSDACSCDAYGTAE